ncbi:HNH endonuclease [Luteirhabdus pelagi]|uniref:HNH endonuclease n=1 Tax=Luteirhabdus pelagi TaxID=2792783 RepID=UPI001939D82D|nr:HNH endonuclease signature motif containing protein [Luteirhabdus pelagi]
MQNLTHLDIDYFDWYKEIIKSKKENEFFIKQDSLDSIENRYKEYMENFDSSNLILIKDSIYSKNHPELTSCYKSKTKKVSELITKIKDAQTTETKSKCQYCGINRPKTMDHYLPISLYPEYAVLAINLLPCCNDCNKKKDNYWKEEGFRGILNFYIDNIPDEQFLVGNIIIQNNLPSFIVNFDFSMIDKDFSNIVTAHYKRLELFERYSQESADEISEISRQLSIYSSDKTVDEISKLLKTDANDLQIKYGKNYWKAILRAALSASIVYLNNYKKYVE